MKVNFPQQKSSILTIRDKESVASVNCTDLKEKLMRDLVGFPCQKD